MAERILVKRLPGQIQTALVENGRLVSFFADFDHEPSMVGAILVGQAARSNPKAQQALVDLGRSDGFGEVFVSRTKNGSWPTEGQQVLVQIVRDPLPGKRAVGGLDPEFCGTFLGLRQGPQRAAKAAGAGTVPEEVFAGLPESNGIWRPLRPLDEAAPSRLQDEAATLTTQAQTAAAAVLDADAGAVVRSPFSGFDLALRACADIAPEVVVQALGDNRWSTSTLSAPPHIEIDRWHRPADLFATDDIDSQLDEALARSADIAGARITIDPTEALTAIDIDTDAGTIRAPSRQQALVKAALERARLLDIGGLLALDLPGPVKRKAAIEGAKSAARADPLTLRFEPPGAFNVMLASRQRSRPSLLEQFFEPEGMVSRRPNPTWAALSALSAAAHEASINSRNNIRISVPKAVAKRLEGILAPALDRFRGSFPGTLEIVQLSGEHNVGVPFDVRLS